MEKYNIDNGEQAVREIFADLLEAFSKQIKSGKEPRTLIQYFGATFEIKLHEFKGIYDSKEQGVKLVSGF